jgi:hypothetical protein
MDVTYEARDGYLYVGVAGEFNPSRSRGRITTMLETLLLWGHDRVLWDISRVTGFEVERVSVMYRFDASQLIASSLPKDFKLAVLQTPAQLDPERFGETVMSNRGVMVKVTTDLDEALEWLGVGREAQSVASRPD